MQKREIIKTNNNAFKIMALNAVGLPDNRHTEEMEDIITKVPSWILRWGITLFFGILLVVVSISVIIRYPDTLKTNLKIMSPNIALPVNAPVSGELTKILIKKGEIVKKGQPLAIMTNITDPGKTFILTAPQDGEAAFVAIVQTGYQLKVNQQVFTINPANSQYFGVIELPGSNINKIKLGQQVLIKLRNYPEEEYGQLKGTISYIADEPGREGFFTLKVNFDKSGLQRTIQLKTWMVADAEIITKDVSVESRVLKSIFKGLQ